MSTRLGPLMEGTSQEALDGAPFGYLAFRDDGAITAVNTSALELLGYSRSELVGRPLETLLTVGAKIFYQTHFFPLLSLHGRADEIYLVLRARSGESVGVLANAVRRDRGGSAVNQCAFLRVRERERFEQELLRARRAAEEAQVALGGERDALRRANEALEEHGVELEAQQRALEDQAQELEVQAEELQAANLLLTERGEELERQRAAADVANRAKSSFLAVMSHELRTPLNAIGGYVQLLEMGIHGPITEAQAEALRRIDRSQRHLLRLINDVLNLSRIESGRVEYAIEEVPLDALLESVTPMVEPQLAAKQIGLRVRVQAGEWARADREKVQQIVLNLLGNAVKFTPEGGSVEVTTHQRPELPDFVFLAVADTGPGIPRPMQDSIFEPFVQVDASHTRRSEGSGLGLAISRDLARGMGGDLRVRSTEGSGSTFTLALPRCEAGADA